MLRTDLTDHRGTDDARLLSALAAGDAIALAEAYHRTVTAAHACARRMLASPVEIEALMRAVYGDLWDEPPTDASLEGWVRARCFNLGAGYLRQRNLRAPSLSLAAFTSGIEADAQHGGNDSLEQIIAELTEPQRRALVRAHDQGIRTAEQDDPEAGWSLLHALLVLASPLTDDERHAAEMCSSGVALANWIFGLLPPHEASTVPGTAAEPTPCGRLAGVLRRARRRFEPLPPTPDLGHRVLASVLSNGASRSPAQGRESGLESDLRVAYADLGRSQPSHDEPPSSLDMTVSTPLPSPSGPPPAGGHPGDNGRPVPRGWNADEDDRTTPLRASGPAALAASNGPAAHGNAALAPAPDPDERASDDLVRMPLRRPGGRPPLRPTDDSGPLSSGTARSPLPEGDPTILRPSAHDDQNATLPPPGLRPPRDHGERRGGPQPRGLRSFDSDEGSAVSPLGSEERRGPRAERDATTDSPLRRPTPQSRSFDTQSRSFDTQSRSFDTQQPPSRPAPPPPRGLEPGPRPPQQQRDDSALRFDDVFNGFGDDATIPPSTDQAATTTAAMPAMRRRAEPPARPGPSRPQQAPPPPAPTPMLEDLEDDEPTGGAGVLRWVVVLVLIALGAAFGIWLGQLLIS